jgi:hypothetical protein
MQAQSVEENAAIMPPEVAGFIGRKLCRPDQSIEHDLKV